MSDQTVVRTREKWVDDVKVIACILVVLGHFFQSMTNANILPENDLYKWFNTTIYYFHVPLRSVLLKIGITNAVIHVIMGLGISFVGPTVAAWIMKKTKWLEFFLYPNKFLGKAKLR